MLRHLFFWLLVVSFSLPGLETYALPKTMIMTTEMVSHEAGRNIKAHARIWYSDMKFRTEVESNMAVKTSSAVQINNRATVIMDMKRKTGYMLDERNKTAIRIDSRQVNQMTGGNGRSGATSAQYFNDPTFLSDPAKLRAELKNQGGVQVGKTNLLGHPCTIWEITKQGNIPAGQGKTTTEMVTVKLWLAEDLVLPLKVEVSTDKRGLVATMKTQSIEVNIPIKASLFSVPGGYQITDLADMFKSQSGQRR